MKQTDDRLLYFPVNTSINFHRLKDWKMQGQHKYVDSNSFKTPTVFSDSHSFKCYESGAPNLALVNGVSLALFRYGERAYAVQSRCPHAGGPLHLADIEETVSGDGTTSTHIICPWHKWRFDLNTGLLILPQDRLESLHTYPVKVDPGSGQHHHWISFIRTLSVCVSRILG